MSLKITDQILSKRVAEPRAVVEGLSGPSANDFAYGERLTHWCRVSGVDGVVALIQWLHETGNGESSRWTWELNPTGIGVEEEEGV